MSGRIAIDNPSAEQVTAPPPPSCAPPELSRSSPKMADDTPCMTKSKSDRSGFARQTSPLSDKKMRASISIDQLQEMMGKPAGRTNSGRRSAASTSRASVASATSGNTAPQIGHVESLKFRSFSSAALSAKLSKSSRSSPELTKAMPKSAPSLRKTLTEKSLVAAIHAADEATQASTRNDKSMSMMATVSRSLTRALTFRSSAYASSEGEDDEDEEDEEQTPQRSTLRGERLKKRRGSRRLERRLAKAKLYKALQGFVLAFALLGGSFWQICNFPDDPGNAVLDAIMLCVTAAFMFDLILLSRAEKNYVGSFFFWMDILGTASMVFEISFLLSPAGKMNTPDTSVDTKVMRTARTAKLGARSARLVKLLKCLSFIFGTEVPPDKFDGARILSAKLAHYLSTKSAMLTIMFALLMPMLSIGEYPEDDLSLRGWVQRLENDYELAVSFASMSNVTHESSLFQDALAEMETFYSQAEYSPYRIEGYDPKLVIDGIEVMIPGQSSVQGGHAARYQNIVRQRVTNCGVRRSGCEGSQKAAIYFDFTKPHQVEATMSILTMVFIVGAMIVSSSLLMNTAKAMVLVPVDKMMNAVRISASRVLGHMVSEFEEDSDDEEETEAGSELGMLVVVFAKLQRLVEIHSMRQDDIVDEEEMEAMDDASKGVLVDMMCVDSSRRRTVAPKDSIQSTSARTRQTSQGEIVSQNISSEAREAVETWKLHILELSCDSQKAVVLYMFFDSLFGHKAVRPFIDAATFQSFQDCVDDGYVDAPYHNFPHACDVCYTVYRLVHETRSEEWAPDVERFSLLMASLCHDLGHEGKTNIFLVETRHELALCYNDRSPLENMHASNMFKICNDEESNVFKNLGKEEYKKARKVCVSTILHTDNCHHFEMVKTVREIYELNSATCEAHAEICGRGKTAQKDYVEEVMLPFMETWLQLFLHLADVSNPLKPWIVCQAWAGRVLDEFFAQGDEEKRLSLPVGMLNDRDKINRPHSQHGFIKFLVAPFATVSVRVFPSLHPLTTNMTSNYEKWRDVWASNDKPPTEELDAVAADLLAMKVESEQLVARCEHRQSESPTKGGKVAMPRGNSAILSSNPRKSVASNPLPKGGPRKSIVQQVFGKHNSAQP